MVRSQGTLATDEQTLGHTHRILESAKLAGNKSQIFESIK